jgi:phage I-like protein
VKIGKTAVSSLGNGTAIVAGPWRPIAELVASKASGKVGGEPPSEILLFPNPTWELADMDLVTDDESQTAVIAEFEHRGIDIVIDYDHQTLEAATSGNPAPAAAWIKGMRGGKSGLFGTKIDWTARGSNYIGAGEYRYFSPVAIFEEASGRVISLHSVALTNTPRTNKQAPLTAKLAASISKQNGREGAMKKWMKLLKAALGRAASLTRQELADQLEAVKAAVLEDGDAEGAIVSAKNATRTLAANLGIEPEEQEPDTRYGEICELVDLDESAPLKKVKAAILKLSNGKVDQAEHDRVVAELKTATTNAASQTVEQLIAANVKKLTPALTVKFRKIASRNLDEAKELLEDMPEQLPVSKGADVAGREEELDPISETVEVGDGEVRKTDPESSAIATSVYAIMKEKGLTYVEANALRKVREAQQ